MCVCVCVRARAHARCVCACVCVCVEESASSRKIGTLTWVLVALTVCFTYAFFVRSARASGFKFEDL